MGIYKFEDAVMHPEGLCEDCSNIIGSIHVMGNSPHKHEGKGIAIKPQWMLSDKEAHATISVRYNIRSHTDPEHAKKFVVDCKDMRVNLCEIGKKLPFVHVERQAHNEFPEIRKELDAKGVPRLVEIDGEKWCKFCNCHQTYQAYANGSWVSPVESCTNPECVKNGGPIDEWQKHIDNKVICPECEWHMQKGKCVNKLCEVYVE